VTRLLAGRRGAGIAGLALVASLALGYGCGRPSDEAWLQFLGFKQGGVTVGVFEDNLRGTVSDTVDVEFQNGSQGVGVNAGTGVLLERARIDYRMDGFFPPSAEVPLNLYLDPPAASTTTPSTPTTGTLSAFPLAPPSLKQWLIGTGAFENAVARPAAELTAQVTFFARAADGTKLETKGGVTIVLVNNKSTRSVAAGTSGRGR
jgi:hypothetical protein